MAFYPFYTWLYHPEPPEAVHKILEQLTDDEVKFLLHHEKEGPGLRLAWLEFGRRKGLIDFEIRVTRTKDSVTVEAEGKAKPLHYDPILIVSKN